MAKYISRRSITGEVYPVVIPIGQGNIALAELVDKAASTASSHAAYPILVLHQAATNRWFRILELPPDEASAMVDQARYIDRQQA